MRLGHKLSPITMAFIVSLNLLITGCGESEQTAGAPAAASKQTVNVEVITLKAQPHTVKTQLPGRITAYRIAEIRPQVNGTILKREFTEGTDVKAQQSLYQIDPALYQASYNNAVASLNSAQANARVARLTANRLATLIKSKAISKQDYDKAVATAEQADASVKMAQAAVNQAKINLNYTKVYSPIDGYIGKSNVTEGALVSVGQPTALATVQQIDPIYVDMTQSFEDYSKVQQNIANGYYNRSSGKMEVELRFNDGSVYPHKGVIELSEQAISESTGSLALRAVFPNPQRSLLPGMFVKPLLVEGTIQKAILVPQKAVARNTMGLPYVKLVKEDGEVITQMIDANKTIGSEWLVTKGLKDGDRVVSSGLMAFNMVKPGLPVYANIIEPKPADDAASAPNSNQSK